ncbi:MAG: YraN family protein [Schwartzia sp.]|nr:YraN family protein [Schwartzia sp. (in: firmicutes)]
MNTKVLGNRGEAAAADYLAAKGYEIRERQYRSPMGEIDLIASRDGALIFAEVKTRRSTRYGAPASAVDFRKQRRIINAATWYVEQKGYIDMPCRFDVIEVYAMPDGKYEITHYENAFDTDIG